MDGQRVMEGVKKRKEALTAKRREEWLDEYNRTGTLSPLPNGEQPSKETLEWILARRDISSSPDWIVARLQTGY